MVLWLIRATAASAPVREPVVDRASESPDHPAATLRRRATRLLPEPPEALRNLGGQP